MFILSLKHFFKQLSLIFVTIFLGCFQFQNGSLTKNFTDDALKFRKYYNKTTTCITTYKNLVSKDELCSICFDDYLKLNDFYHHIKRKNQDSICFDIVDLVSRDS